MNRDHCDAIVVGAGIVGASAALAMARDGRRVALIEAQVPRPWSAAEADLRVVAFAPDNAALLDDLGVWPAVTGARAPPYRHMRVWDAAGGGELHFHADAIGRDALGWIVENALLTQALWQTLATESGIRRYCPDRVQRLDADDLRVRVTLESGRHVTAPVLVAADGADSPTRTLAGMDVSRQDYGQCGLVAYVQTEHPHQDTAWQRFLPTGPLAFLPFREDVLPRAASGHVCSIVWTLPEPEARRLRDGDSDAFCRELCRAFDSRLGEVVAVSARAAFPLRRQLARSYVSGRVLLAGDAAHVVHPLAGQGVNLGLRDVVCLRELLRQAGDRDPGAAHRLARYQRRRHSEDTVAAYGFDAINRLFSNDQLLPTLLRGPALGLLGRVAPLTQRLARIAAGV